jgi:OmpA-OmpF porin, OOP family
MTVHKSIAVATLALGVAGAAQGADFYVGAGLGSSALWEDEAAISVTDRQDVGYKLWGGVQFNPFLAVELGWADMGKADISATTAAGTAKGTLAVEGWFLDLVGTYEVRPGWSLLGRIGMFNGKAKVSVNGAGSTSDTNTDFKFGIGVQYDLSKTINVRGEWERGQLDVHGTSGHGDLLSVGLNYRF